VWFRAGPIGLEGFIMVRFFSSSSSSGQVQSNLGGALRFRIPIGLKRHAFRTMFDVAVSSVAGHKTET
jgi:hypothetical protein